MSAPGSTLVGLSDVALNLDVGERAGMISAHDRLEGFQF